MNKILKKHTLNTMVRFAFILIYFSIVIFVPYYVGGLISDSTLFSNILLNIIGIWLVGLVIIVTITVLLSILFYIGLFIISGIHLVINWVINWIVEPIRENKKS